MAKSAKSARAGGRSGSGGIGDAARRLWEKAMTGRPPRERQLIGWGGLVSLILVLIFGLWMPMQESRTRLARSVAVERKNLALMDVARKEIQRQSTSAAMPLSGVALRGVIEDSVKSQLAPAVVNVRLDGENSVVVKFSRARLSKVLGWIDTTVKGQRLRLDSVVLKTEDSRLAGELRFVIPES